MGHVTRFTRVHTLLALCATLVLAACTQDTGSSASSKLRLSLPDWNAQSASLSQKSGAVGALDVKAFTGRIMINVSGAGISAPIVYIWEARDDITNAPPESIELSVPRGSARLVQVLIIKKDVLFDATGKAVSKGVETFYYGDASKDLGSANENIALDLTRVDVGAAAAEGTVGGRYMTGNDEGPTGKLSILYAPANGRPPMIVDTTEMHGGWFEAYALEGAEFSYVLDNNQKILPGLKLGVNEPATNDARNIVVTIPSGFKNVYAPNAPLPFARTVTRPKRSVLGYFGPGSSGKSVCYPSDAGLFVQSLYSTTDLGNTTQISWVGANSAATPGVAGVIEGGTATAGGICGGDTAGANRYANWLGLNMERLEDSHEVLGFRGPFRGFQANGSTSTQFLHARINPVTSKVEVEWRLLPGVTGADRVEAMGVFARAVDASGSNYQRADYETSNGIACNDLAKYNFTLLTKVAANSPPVSLPEITLANFNAGKVEFIACPWSQTKSKYFESGVSFRSYGGGGGGQVGVVGLALLDDKMIRGASPATSFPKNICYPVTIAVLNNSGQIVQQANSPRSLSLSTEVANALFSDPACTIGGSNTLAISQFWGFQTVFLKTAGSTGSASVTATDIGPVPLTSDTLTLTKSGTATAAVKVTTNLPDGKVRAFECQTIRFSARTADDILADASGTYFNLNPSGIPGFQFYDENNVNCENTPMSVVSFSTGLPTKTMRFRYARLTGTTLDLAPADTAINFPGIALPAAVYPIQLPGVANRLSFRMNANLRAETCEKIAIDLRDTSLRIAPNDTGSAISIGLLVTGAALFTDGSCTTADSNPTTLSVADGAWKTNYVYIKAASPGPLSMTATSVGYVPEVFASGFGMAAASQLRVVWPGESRAGSSITGTPLSQIENVVSTTMEIVALTPSGLIDPSYNVNFASITSPPWMTFPSGGGFTNGVATVQVLFDGIAGLQSAISLTSPGIAYNTPSSPLRILPKARQLHLLGVAGTKQYSCSAAYLYLGHDLAGDMTSATTPAAGVTVTFTGVSNTQIYEDLATCESVGTPVNVAVGIQIPGGSRGRYFFYRPIASTGGFGFMPSTGLYGTSNLSSAASLTAQTLTALQLSIPPNFARLNCQAAMVSLVDAGNYAMAAPAGGVDVTFTVPSGQYTLYADDTCTTVAPSLTVPVGMSGKAFFIKTTSTAAPGVFTAATTNLGGSNVSTAGGVNVYTLW